MGLPASGLSSKNLVHFSSAAVSDAAQSFTRPKAEIQSKSGSSEMNRTYFSASLFRSRLKERLFHTMLLLLQAEKARSTLQVIIHTPPTQANYYLSFMQQHSSFSNCDDVAFCKSFQPSANLIYGRIRSQLQALCAPPPQRWEIGQFFF